MTTRFKTTITETFRAMDDRRFDQITKFHTEDCNYRMNHDVMNGTAPFLAMCQGWYGGFPDLQHEVIEYLESADQAAYTLRVTGTHTDTMRPPHGAIPATGKRIDFRAIDIVRFGADGRAVSWHIYFDPLVMMQQLGLAS